MTLKIVVSRLCVFRTRVYSNKDTEIMLYHFNDYCFRDNYLILLS